MSENDLFGAADAPESMTRPLAVRMRPRTLDEVIGQTQVLGQGSPLRRLANPASKGSLTAPSSVILFGPPGVGKPRSPPSWPANPAACLRNSPP